MPVYRYLDLSTAHLTEAEMFALTANFPALDDAGPRVIVHDYGAWLNVPAADDPAAEDDLAEHYPNVARCLEHARAAECSWINFDGDAEQEADLPTYDW